MLCPECDIKLKILDGWLGVGLGKGAIKLKGYVCNHRGCEAYRKLWFKSLETDEAVDPPLITKHLDKLEKY